MTTSINVLDHGYVKLIETWGSDERIIEAARMSTGKGFQGWGPKPCEHCGVEYGKQQLGNCTNGGPHVSQAGDEKLLAYLWKNNHATPFEMAGMIIEVQAPIFVFREWHRHRTQSYNEMSARYTPLPDLNYIPSIERLMLNAGGSNKQAGTVAGAAVLTDSEAEAFRMRLAETYSRLQTIYKNALLAGIPKELARIHLPVGRYSRMRASANLRNWFGFEFLRLPSTAQWEIRQFAQGVGTLLQQAFPRSWALFAATLKY